MKAHIIDTRSEKKKVVLEPDHLNVILEEEGIYHLPTVCQTNKVIALDVLLTAGYPHFFYSEEYKVSLGTCAEKCFSPYAVNQWSLVFIPQQKMWFIFSQGNFMFYDKEDLNTNEAYAVLKNLKEPPEEK